MSKLAVLAIGGNSLIASKERQSVEDQYEQITKTCENIADLIQMDVNVVITHGNGPQVGFIMRRSEIANEVEKLHHVPLYSCGADTQGAIGYQIQQALHNEFRKRGMDKKAVTVVTMVEVDKNDPAFKNPTKPIGTFYSKDEIEDIKKEHPDWDIVFDSNRGYRRVVASPKPVSIVEEDMIKLLVKENFCVVAAGGGGIPVVRDEKGNLVGANAVIDKDNATSLLATNLNADYFIISTAVDNVCINFGKPDQKSLSHMNLADIKKYKAQGQFAPGSMLPKIEAVEKFLESGGKKAIITSPDRLKEAIKEEGGTIITK